MMLALEYAIYGLDWRAEPPVVELEDQAIVSLYADLSVLVGIGQVATPVRCSSHCRSRRPGIAEHVRYLAPRVPDNAQVYGVALSLLG